MVDYDGVENAITSAAARTPDAVLVPIKSTFPNVRPLSRAKPVWETGRAIPL